MRRRDSAPADSPIGQSLLEFALVLPLLLLVIFGILDLGFAVYANNTVALSAREGARRGVIKSATDADVCNQVINTAQSLNLNCGANVRISPSPNRVDFQPITVTVVYTYVPFSPIIGSYVGNSGLPLRSVSSMTVE